MKDSSKDILQIGTKRVVLFCVMLWNVMPNGLGWHTLSFALGMYTYILALRFHRTLEETQIERNAEAIERDLHRNRELAKDSWGRVDVHIGVEDATVIEYQDAK